MDNKPCVYLGIKIKPGPIERHKIENFGLENTVDSLKNEAEKKTNVPSSSLELIHHGKILRDDVSLQDSGIKVGEMVHVVKKKVVPPPPASPTYTDAELQQIVTALRSFGCTPNAPGWTRAMQILNDESTMAEILEAVPSLSEDCVTLSILHEVELLAALGASVQTMRRGAEARPDLPAALQHLIRLVRSRSATTPTSNDNAPTSGFAYSLEALSEDEDGDDDENEEGERNIITQEQLAAALQVATQAVSANASSALMNLLNSTPSAESTAGSSSSGSGNVITPEMFSEAISEAILRAGSGGSAPDTPMDQSTTASSPASGAPAAGGEFSQQLRHMHEMGLLDDAVNLRALLICSGDVNAAINLVFNGAVGDD